jgi:enoyl-CoA hydratase/carnithine racemase
MTTATPPPKSARIRLTRRSAAYWRVTIDNPPINVMSPEMIEQFHEIINALETDADVRVVVFDSAVDDYFLNHSDFTANFDDFTELPAGPTGLPQWPDFLVRLTRAPVVSIALIRGRATGNGSELTLASDMSFASREKAILSQWEVGVGLVAGGGPMARLPQLIGRNRALEVLLSSEDIRGEQAEAYGYVNRALPDAELDAFVEALATRISGFDKWANRQHQAPRQHEPATGGRARRQLGCVHGLDRATGCPGRHPSTDGARLSPTWRCRKPSRVLPRPDQTVTDNQTIWRASPMAVAEGFEPPDGFSRLSLSRRVH